MPVKVNLLKEEIDADYIAITQKSNYADSPEWKDVSKRNAFMHKHKLRFLRPYQIDALKSVQKSVEDGNDRFLFEMATGTETLTYHTY